MNISLNRYVIEQDARAAYVGKHLILDLIDIDQTFDVSHMLHMFENACLDAGATILFSKVQEFGKDCGTTGIIILAESHLSWHWYNETESIFIDLFTCGNTDPTIAIDRILNFFKPKKVNQQLLTRGRIKLP